MFVEEAIRQTVDLSATLCVLDLCAAPGGKSTLIQSIISKESLLVSNEVIKARVNVLSENISKWGAANVVITNNDPSDFKRLPGFFDVIVVDAPCSGSGLFRKDPEAVREWSEQNVFLCSQRQQRIMADIMPSLKEGGILVENFQLESLPLQVPAEWNIVLTKSAKYQASGYRFYPDQVKGEGFFIAVFKKPGGGEQHHAKFKMRSEKLPAAAVQVMHQYLEPGNKLAFYQQKDEVIAIPPQVELLLPALQSALYIKKAGIKMGTLIRNELIPDHELAMSTQLKQNLSSIELNLDDALQYLRKQDFKLESDVKGWTILKYNQLALGWVKMLPNRINNYYPKEWRILNK
jgi:NOL1/NOP2/fmu family ribosome biogenesis protein